VTAVSCEDALRPRPKARAARWECLVKISKLVAFAAIVLGSTLAFAPEAFGFG
jgi:hypothetical protein